MCYREETLVAVPPGKPGLGSGNGFALRFTVFPLSISSVFYSCEPLLPYSCCVTWRRILLVCFQFTAVFA